MNSPFSLDRMVGSLLLCMLAAHASAQTAVTARPLAEVLLPAAGRAAASVLSPNDAVIAAQISAPVLKLHADAGASVARGDLLVELDSADQRLLLAQADAALASAKARLALADQRLTRGQALGAKSFIAPDDLLELGTSKQAAAADVKAAQAQRDIAARSLEKCRIVAPFDAAVLERFAQVGALAVPGTPLLRLIDLAPAEIETRLPVADAAELLAADRLEFETAGVRHPLRLLRVSEVVDPTSRTRLARLAFAANGAAAGSTGQLHWRAKQGRLPATLLVKRDGALGIFTVENGNARFVPLPDAQDGRPASAASLSGSLMVVSENQQSLNDGDAITVRTR